MRNPILAWASRDEVKQAALTIPAARELVSDYVAGERWGDLSPVLSDLEAKGLAVSVEYLGARGGPADAVRTLAHYLELVDRLAASGHVGAELSIRLNGLGLDPGKSNVDAVAESTLRIVRAAVNAGLFPILDMSGACEVPHTLAVWSGIRQDFPEFGITMQANLHRTRRDIEQVALPGARVRLCKGSHLESRQVAFRSQHEIDLAFVRSLRVLMQSEATLIVATHDPRMIEITEALVSRNGRAKQKLEFQMLQGVRPLELRRLADIGYLARCYVPYGPGWYEYYLRRLAERPANAALFARSVVRKK
ncbi:hypothetical protein HMPREF1531_01362 [Propionibacterium sp. oral taxon 192 str. F0372]|uniref:proline dehydrogenase family protein n=1 Tax=Propionibacterium sp. oral taxon 192 TaxID=671222 RepID=UPI0003546380|nr:proline dehydrogenase family protein [Propionibacterium sp. oral taxon 192]EPH03303.1 hypothetical protein HMPREF1531_01362 [Propionibacterium sp. oral taxon 192 str. F0372]